MTTEGVATSRGHRAATRRGRLPAAADRMRPQLRPRALLSFSGLVSDAALPFLYRRVALKPTHRGEEGAGDVEGRGGGDTGSLKPPQIFFFNQHFLQLCNAERFNSKEIYA